MTISHRYHTDRAGLALELTMRDALEGLEELANLDACGFDTGCVEILGIEPPAAEAAAKVTPLRRPAATAKVLSFPENHARTG